MRKLIAALIVCLTVTTIASAQTPDWRFHWQTGQINYYRVEHTTNVAEVVGGSKVETKSKVNLIKRWEVMAVDAQGIATVKLSITAMRNEQTRPGGETVMFDSREPDTGTPELREQLSKFIGQTLAILRVDARGRVVEVKQGAANRFEVEPPFTLVLPVNPATAGQSWERNYTIALDPPLGTGQKYGAKQKHTCTKIESGMATIAITTVLARMPEKKTEQLPLLQKLPEGEVVFDLAHGRVQSVRMTIDKLIQGHQGEGSSYKFQSSYTEKFAE